MLSKTKVVKKARKALELLYDGICTVTEHQKVKKKNGSTGFEEVAVFEDLPCRLSYQTINSTSQIGNGASAVVQVVKLFISPDVKIESGSKITVTQNNMTVDYQQSGESAIYDTHQEIILDLFKGWS